MENLGFNLNFQSTTLDPHHNYPPPPYSSATSNVPSSARFSGPANPLINLEPLSMLPLPQHHHQKGSTNGQQYRQPSPQSPLQDRHLSLRSGNDLNDPYFMGSSNGSQIGDVVVVPPRPPRQQQPLFQRSNSAGSSTAGRRDFILKILILKSSVYFTYLIFPQLFSTRAQHLLHQLHQNTQQQHYPKENRANLILQQLRADDGAQSESDVSTNEPMYHHSHQHRASFGRAGATNAHGMMHSKGLLISFKKTYFLNYSLKRLPGFFPPRLVFLGLAYQLTSTINFECLGVVYLEFNKEVKRSNLPTRLCTFEQIKSLFLRSFPNLTLQFLNQEHVKIYIADRQSSMASSENVLFYELEDLK